MHITVKALKFDVPNKYIYQNCIFLRLSGKMLLIRQVQLLRAVFCLSNFHIFALFCLFCMFLCLEISIFLNGISSYIHNNCGESTKFGMKVAINIQKTIRGGHKSTHHFIQYGRHMDSKLLNVSYLFFTVESRVIPLYQGLCGWGVHIYSQNGCLKQICK